MEWRVTRVVLLIHALYAVLQQNLDDLEGISLHGFGVLDARGGTQVHESLLALVAVVDVVPELVNLKELPKGLRVRELDAITQQSKRGLWPLRPELGLSLDCKMLQIDVPESSEPVGGLPGLAFEVRDGRGWAVAGVPLLLRSESVARIGHSGVTSLTATYSISNWTSCGSQITNPGACSRWGR